METELEDDITENADEVTTEVAKTTVEPKDDELRRTMAELASTVKTLATPKPEKEPELTQEQQAEMWAIYDPEKSRKDFFTKWFRLNPDATAEEKQEAKDMFGEMQKGLVKQSIVGARNLYKKDLDEALKKLREEFTPAAEYASASRAEKTRERFYSQYPALVDTNEFKFSKAVNDTARELANKEFANEDAYFKALSEGAAERVKGYNPSFDLGAKPATKPSAGTSPRLPRTSVGGTGGTNGGGGTGKAGRSDDDSDSIDWTK